MTIIRQRAVTTLADGFVKTREYATDRHYVRVSTDEYHFTIYDAYDEPCGSLHRPRRDGADGANQQWTVYNARGERIASHASGPLACFRSFAMWYDVNSTVHA